MPAQPPRHRRGRRSRRVVPVAAVLVAAAAPCAAAGAQAVPPSATAGGTTVTVVGDSVIVAGQPLGQASIRVTRPDATTGQPVVIGLFSALAQPSQPFTVNTTTPTALSPDGDCWQAGALSQALTPDILPGDTVTVAGEAGPLGAAAPSTSLTVPADGSGGDSGPIPSCRSIAPFAQNTVTSAPKTVTGGAIDVSGVSQPLASGVSTSVSDGTHSTAPVDVTPNADGSWSSTIPANQVDGLANGALTLQPVFAVPDVSTGATGHIAGAPVAIEKRSEGQAASGQSGSGQNTGSSSQPGSSQAPANGFTRRVSKLAVRSSVSLAGARRDGLSASFVVPQGARVIDVRLQLGSRVLLRRVATARGAGARQVVRLKGSALRPFLHRGRYTLAVRAGSSRSRLGPAVVSAIRVR